MQIIYRQNTVKSSILRPVNTHFIAVGSIVYIPILGLSTLFSTTKRRVDEFEESWYSTIDALDIHEISEDKVTAAITDNREAMAAMANVAVESVVFGVTSKLDPGSGAIIEYSMVRSLLPYVVAVAMWLVVLGFRFVWFTVPIT